MKIYILLALVVVSTASPIGDSQETSVKKTSSITENLQKFKELVLDKFEQIRSGRSVKRQTNTTEVATPSAKTGRMRNSKIMRFEEPVMMKPQEEIKSEEQQEPEMIEEQQKEQTEQQSEEQQEGEAEEGKQEEEVDNDVEKRKQKNLNLFPYSFEQPYYHYNPSLGYYYTPPKDFSSTYNLNIPDEWLGRTEPFKRKNTQQLIDSPIYYIRLPPSPYVFVPGVGYVSRPPSLNEPEVINSINDVKQQENKPNEIQPNNFLHVPIDFVSNGKPTSIYQLPNDPIKPVQKPEINLDKGPYLFNGRPIDIYILRNSYNSLYADALTNFYP